MKKILVVDDDINIRNSLSAILTSEGYEVSIAEDKAETFKKLKETGAELILLDVHISSNQEGYEIASELLADKNYKNIGVIILTSTEIVSGNQKIVELARKFRNNPQFGYINAILNVDNNGAKILEYKAEGSGEIISLPVHDAVSKPINTDILIKSISNYFG